MRPICNRLEHPAPFQTRRQLDDTTTQVGRKNRAAGATRRPFPIVAVERDRPSAGRGRVGVFEIASCTSFEYWRHGDADRGLGRLDYHLGGEVHRRLDFVARRLEHEFVLAASALGVASVEQYPRARGGVSIRRESDASGLCVPDSLLRRINSLLVANQFPVVVELIPCSVAQGIFG